LRIDFCALLFLHGLHFLHKLAAEEVPLLGDGPRGSAVSVDLADALHLFGQHLRVGVGDVLSESLQTLGHFVVRPELSFALFGFAGGVEFHVGGA
jgi:hypothetical protein